jgi:hypothetical protein
MTTGDRVRPAYVTLFIAVIVGVMATITVQGVRRAHDRDDRRSAAAAAHRLPAPSGTTVSHDCHGDGTVICYRSTRLPAALVGGIEADLASAGHHPVSRECDDSGCVLTARWGRHGVFVFIRPARDRVGGRAVTTGSQVNVSTD